MVSRSRLIGILQTMPDEAFGYILYGAVNVIPQGLGGFMSESRKSLIDFQQATKDYIDAVKAQNP